MRVFRPVTLSGQAKNFGKSKNLEKFGGIEGVFVGKGNQIQGSFILGFISGKSFSLNGRVFSSSIARIFREEGDLAENLKRFR